MTIELPNEKNKLKRRSFFKVGIATGALLLIYKFSGPKKYLIREHSFFYKSDFNVLFKLIPGILFINKISVTEIKKIILNIDTSISYLTPETQKELRDLFDLLGSNFLIRGSVLGIWNSWDKLENKDVVKMMQELKDSRFQIKRQVYNALNKIIHGVYYSDPITWKSIGYPGPPEVNV